MSDLREAAQQALDAQKEAAHYLAAGRAKSMVNESIAALTAALALPDAQPVLWELRHQKSRFLDFFRTEMDAIKTRATLDAEGHTGAVIRPLIYTVPQPAIDADALAQEIRRVNGNNKMGAGELAERLIAFLTGKPAQPAVAPPDAQPVGYMRPDELQKAKEAPYLCRVHPAKDKQVGMVPVYSTPQTHNAQPLRRISLDLLSAINQAMGSNEWQGECLAGYLTEDAVAGLLVAHSSKKLPNAQPVAWMPVIGHESLYEVSAGGNIRSLKTGNILSCGALAGDGYVKASLWKEGERKQTYAHRVVAEAFLGSGEGMEINHKNGVKTDNRVENLEWCSRSDNVNHGYYTLGHLINPVRATPKAGGQPIEFPSVEAAVRAGFDSSHISGCLRNPLLTHKGYHWGRISKGTTPQPAA